MGKFLGVLTLIVIIIGFLFGPEAQIEWAVYFSIPLMIIFGTSVGVAFVTRRFEAIICGVLIGAAWPIVFG
jgi:hypothetical protein